MVLSDLEDFGLTTEESKVYIAVLELGGSYVSTIAKKSAIPRVNCYHTLNNLVKKGLISSFTKNNIKHFSVESPQILVNQFEEKFHHAKRILPELLSITNALAFKPKIQYYEGLGGIKNIFEDSLTEKKEILGYTNLAALPKVIPAEYLKEYTARKIKLGIKTRMMSPTSKEGLNYLKNYYPKNFNHDLVEIFFVNPKEFMFEYEINIYGDRVSLVSLNPNELLGLIIESPVYAKTERSIFNLAWLGATSFVAK
ncbi:MAG: helix-turn-helix domain-containing protein [Candidatus Gracilibacteria bacterium]